MGGRRGVRGAKGERKRVKVIGREMGCEGKVEGGKVGRREGEDPSEESLSGEIGRERDGEEEKEEEGRGRKGKKKKESDVDEREELQGTRGRWQKREQCKKWK